MYRLPMFNLNVNVWTPGTTPNSGPPAFSTTCQVYVGSRSYLDITPGQDDIWVPPIMLRTPLTTPDPLKGGIIGIVGTTFDYYWVRWVQRTHLGFPNEYTTSVAEQCDKFGTRPRP